MKNKILILLGSVALLAGCASQPSASCVLLKFPHAPAPAIVEQLADTQPASDRQLIRDWFAHGETGFILSATHTNEIAAAIADGATAKVIHGSSSALIPIYGKR
jgi:hypothetical protein